MDEKRDAAPAPRIDRRSCTVNSASVDYPQSFRLGVHVAPSFCAVESGTKWFGTGRKRNSGIGGSFLEQPVRMLKKHSSYFVSREIEECGMLWKRVSSDFFFGQHCR